MGQLVFQRSLLGCLAIIAMVLIVAPRGVMAVDCKCKNTYSPGPVACMHFDYYPADPEGNNCKMVQCDSYWFCNPEGTFMCETRDVLGKLIPAATGPQVGNRVPCQLEPRNIYDKLYRKPIQQPPFVVRYYTAGYFGARGCSSLCFGYFAQYRFFCTSGNMQAFSTNTFSLRYPVNNPYSEPSFTFRCQPSDIAPLITPNSVTSTSICGVKEYPIEVYNFYTMSGPYGCYSSYLYQYYTKFCLCQDTQGALNPFFARRILEIPQVPETALDKSGSENGQVARFSQPGPLTFEDLVGSMVASKHGVFNISRSHEWREILTNPKTKDKENKVRRSQFQASKAKYSGRCETVTTPNGKESQTCCEVQDVDEWVCLPTLIVIGAQKSGTTALFAHMLEHPEFRPGAAREPNSPHLGAEPVEKEVHFFDFPGKWSLGPQGYLHSFHSVPTNQRSNFINADFSPSYMIKFETMQGIQELLPRAKIVIMLRDPVERAWSELKMKIRQDIASFEWKRLVSRNAAPLKACVDRAASLVHAKPQAITRLLSKCASPALVQNERWGMLVQSALLSYVQKSNGSQRSTNASTANDIPPLFHVAANGTITMPGLGMGRNGMTRGGYDSEFMDEAAVYDKLVNEINQIERCLVLGDETLKACFGEKLWVSSDLSRAHVLRGMYYAQIQNVFQLFSKDQVWIIENEELRRNPVDVMKRLCRFAGMNDFKFELADAEALSHRIEQHMPGFSSMSGWRLIGKKTRGMEDRGNEEASASLPEAGYGDVPVNIESLLRRFYEPHNEKLFELLGRRFDHWI